MEIKKQTKHSKKNQNIILLVFLFLILLLAIPFTRKPVVSFVSWMGTPFVRTSNSISGFFSHAGETLRFKSSLVAENKALSEKVDDLNSRFSNYNQILQENKDLKSIMSRSENPNFILASVLSKPPVSMYDTLLVDGGEKAGIKTDETVYAYGDIPIGTVEKVSSNTAVVRLYSSSGEKMDARLDPDHIDVTLFGWGGGNFLISLPHDFRVATDTVIVSKELNPKLLAKLEKITSDARDSSQTLLLSSPVNINNLSYVEIATQ